MNLTLSFFVEYASISFPDNCLAGLNLTENRRRCSLSFSLSKSQEMMS